MASPRTGLSPTKADLSRSFRFIHHCHWPGPRSLATTCGVSVDVLSCRYLDVSVPCVRFLHLCIQCKIPFNDTWKPFGFLSAHGLFGFAECLREGAGRPATALRPVWLPHSNSSKTPTSHRPVRSNQ